LVATGLSDGHVAPEDYEGILKAEHRRAEAYLEDVRATVAGSGLTVDIAVTDGDPTTALLAVADERGSGAIVMATHGRGGLTRTLLGSVAVRIVQNATIPVLLVRVVGIQPWTDPSFDRLLVPLDGSALAERALDVVTDLAHPGSTLVLVRVEAPAGASEDYDPLTSSLDACSDDIRRAATEYLGRVEEPLLTKPLMVRTDVRLGAPAEQILAAAQAHDADVVVMATHGRTGPARWWLGSVADEVVRHADRPVLLVSAGAHVAHPPLGETTKTATSESVAQEA
jgi:nucleotide-binding universal stress UspA family protein